MKAGTVQNNSVQKIEIVKVKDRLSFACTDEVSVEEPLEIRISYEAESRKVSRNISVTMRTPGNDPELAVGFLFTEGIISAPEQVKTVCHPQAACSRTGENTVMVELAGGHMPELMNADRNFYTTSSCGVCGKGSIESIRTVSMFRDLEKEPHSIAAETLCHLPEKLRTFQSNFSATGGIHASGIFDLNGNLLALREDVGRHNALDKLIGNAFMAGQLPLSSHILLLSGRASFELIQKAAMAGISIVAAIGAPSSLAVDLAKESDMTLLGFLRDNRFNIYAKSRRLEIKTG
ncbi:formate dehydrogenase accessory sulfurtransferase FdhD [Chryseobacterium gregarium]|uniref:formate dehydrogenase accessory sulfurtransferase FdhD n=1 Tax=Chryseobacterium gregarium TaxID=456299 RepID=UPI0004116F05|nr:formate dehydrogenase accessory sulfurtransferase FdhD [Chryseobacterium gregarium]